jgi:hypothetical protein
MDTRTRIIEYIQSNLAGDAHGRGIGPQTPLLESLVEPLESVWS